ncbi:Uncharacterised protein [Salmonella enterica]|nr:Uncharacterised protein [Salmonella enterica]SUH19534.1 Uncharacterised protein [Salmonella enterica]
MVLTTLPGRAGNAVRRTGLAGFKAFPDTSENESSLVLVAGTNDMREVAYAGVPLDKEKALSA